MCVWGELCGYVYGVCVCVCVMCALMMCGVCMDDQGRAENFFLEFGCMVSDGGGGSG